MLHVSKVVLQTWIAVTIRVNMDHACGQFIGLCDPLLIQVGYIITLIVKVVVTGMAFKRTDKASV